MYTDTIEAHDDMDIMWSRDTVLRKLHEMLTEDEAEEDFLRFEICFGEHKEYRASDALGWMGF